MDLAEQIYTLTRQEAFAKDFGLAGQIQKAAVSIPSNIAEGDERGTNREAAYFFNVAKGSAAEVITQLIIAHRVGYINIEQLRQLEDRAEKIRASLKRLIQVRNNAQNLNPPKDYE